MIVILTEQVNKKKRQLDDQIAALQEKLSELPPGKLLCKRNGKYSKWYQKLNSSLNYIPKSERSLAQELAVKEFYSLKLQDMFHEKEAISAYLAKYPHQMDSTLKLFQPSSLYLELLTNYFHPQTNNLFQWAKDAYETNLLYREQCIYNAHSGNKLRSKSEALIDTELYINKIPFRYECALHLGQKTFFPDFTIRHPKTGAWFYWEHFGMMDDAGYAKNTYEKLEIYNDYNIIPGINLLTTYETRKNPLDIEYVRVLIQHYFL